MKILMMTNTYTPVVGGVEESIRAFTNQFKKRGHQVLIVAPEFKGIPAREEGIVRIPAIQQFNHSDFSVNLPIPGLLSKLMNNFKPDVVHSHHPFLVGDMALRLCGQYSIPLVFTYHTMFEDYLHYLPFRNERIKRFVIELSTGYANLTDQVIVPSQSVYDILLKRGVNAPMDVIPTGVDIRRFATGSGESIRRRFGIPRTPLWSGMWDV
jgi:1,2-diacylglycerol 3-alpha-glucosyltransferase